MRQALGRIALAQLTQLLTRDVAFAEEAAQNSVDETGLRLEAEVLRKLDRFVDGGVIGNAVEPEKLVKPKTQQDLQRGFFGAFAGFLVDEPLQGFFPADDAVSEFLR